MLAALRRSAILCAARSCQVLDERPAGVGHLGDTDQRFALAARHREPAFGAAGPALQSTA